MRAIFILAISLLWAGLSPAQSFSTVFNVAVDIKGDTDTRPGATGLAGYVDQQLYAVVPTGSRIHITHVTGDVVAWPVGTPAVDSKAGVLWGLKPGDGSNGSKYWAVPGSDDTTFVYVQGGVSQRVDMLRIPVDQSADAYVNSNQPLISRLSTWMNSTGVDIHIEATFKLMYEIVGPAVNVDFYRKPEGGTVIGVPHLLVQQERYDALQFSKRSTRVQ